MTGLGYDDMGEPDFFKRLSEKQEAKYLADLTKISLPIAHWARRRLAEGFTVTAVNDCLLVANHRATAHRLKA